MQRYLQKLTNLICVSQGAGSVKRVGRAKPAAKNDSDEGKAEENGSNIDSGDVDSELDSVFHIL